MNKTHEISILNGDQDAERITTVIALVKHHSDGVGEGKKAFFFPKIFCNQFAMPAL